MFQVETKNDILIMSLTQSSVTMYDNEQFKKAFNEVLDKGVKKMVLDMSRTDFISSLVIASLIYVLKQMNSRGGELKICGLKEKVKEVFEMTNLDKIFAIYDTKENALASFV